MRVSPYAGKESPRKGGSFPYQRHPVEMTDEKVSRNMSDEKLNEQIPLVMYFALTPEDNRTVRAAVAWPEVEAGRGRFIVPLGPTARQAGAAASGCGSPQSDSVPR